MKKRKKFIILMSNPKAMAKQQENKKMFLKKTKK